MEIFYNISMMQSAPRGELNWGERPLRSLLFAPGDDSRKLDKLSRFGSDVIVLDLEDAVAASRKDIAARTATAALPKYDKGTIRAIRVNGAETGRLEQDVEAVCSRDLECIIVPKVEHPETVSEVDVLLNRLERNLRVARGNVRVIASIETAAGLVRCDEIARAGAPRLLTLIFGFADFIADIGVELTADRTELLYARSRIVVAARAAGLRPAIDGAYIELQDLEGLVEDCIRSRQLGFQGRAVIYPPHVEHVQRVYSDLSMEEVEQARRVVDAFKRAETRGVASIQVDGRLVDYPIYYAAKRKLAMFEGSKF
jgi:citrate lyase subunit beta/citryl-CoA lyase